MRTDILKQEQKSALALLKDNAEVAKFYLAGGTALALHLGHRYSEDFDFFTNQEFEVDILLNSLQQLGRCNDIRKSHRTLFLEFESIKCSFIFYKYPLLDAPALSAWGFSIASVREIGAMKIMAIGGRGVRRDFIDFYFIIRNYGIETIWHDFEKKYADTGYDAYHFLRALTYFADAETDKMPKMISQAEWNEVKNFLETEIKKIAP